MRLLAKLGLPLVAITAILIINLFVWHQATIGVPFFAGYVLIVGYTLGRKFFPHSLSGTQTFLGSLLLTAIFAILGAIVFYFGKFDLWGIFIILLVPLLFVIDKVREPKPQAFPPSRMSLVTLGAGIGFIFLEFSAFFLLVRSATSSALRSPWERVPAEFFLIFFLASLALFLLCAERRVGPGRIIFISTHAALIFSVALIVFDAGFGFDPFIHRATENYILEHGTISPKHPYYAGEYGLLVFLSRLNMVNLDALNKVFLPLFAAVSLPFLAFWSLLSRLQDKIALRNLTPLAPFCLFLIPLSSFISTTPQGLANLFLLFAIFFGFGGGVALGKGLPAVGLFTIASLLTHPLSGIPAAILFLLLLISKIRSGLVRVPLMATITALSSIIIPLTFVILSAQGSSGGMLKLGELKLQNILELLPKAAIPFRYNFFLDLAYLYKWNLGLLLVLAAFAGFMLLRRNFKNAANSPYIFASFAVLVNSMLLASIISFPALIDYEQGVYAGRLREIAGLLLLPLFITGALWFFDKARAQRHTFIFAILLFPAMATASLYMTYPRTDKYESTHGYNTSSSDIHAVKEIETDAKGEKYIVLSNQALGAAALQEFGFERFYKTPQGEIYFYSVPTGGALYPYYLKMVYETPSRKTMVEAMDVADVKLSYIAINHYWTNARRLTEDLSAIAEKEIIVDGGRVYVYKFKK